MDRAVDALIGDRRGPLLEPQVQHLPRGTRNGPRPSLRRPYPIRRRSPSRSRAPGPHRCVNTGLNGRAQVASKSRRGSVAVLIRGPDSRVFGGAGGPIVAANDACETAELALPQRRRRTRSLPRSRVVDDTGGSTVTDHSQAYVTGMEP